RPQRADGPRLGIHRASDRAFGRRLARAVVALGFGRAADVHGDVELLLERRDAFLQVVAVIDVLAVAEERAFGAFTTGLATALQVDLALGEAVGLAIDLAIDVRPGLARPFARGLAAGLARGRGGRPFAARVAAARTGRFAGRSTFAVARAAGGIAARRAIGRARGTAIELAGIDLALAFTARRTVGATIERGRRIAFARAFHLELRGAGRFHPDRFAFRLASALDLDDAGRLGFDVDVAAGVQSRVCRWSE